MLKRLLPLLVLCLVPLSVSADEPQMKAHFINVGQGASTLLEFPTGAILIDTGGEGDESSRHLVEFLKKFFAGRPDLHNRLNALIISHPHIDHTRGIESVINNCNVECFIDNGLDAPRASGHKGIKFARELSASTGHPRLHPVLDEDVVDVRGRTGLTDDDIDSITAPDVDPLIRVLSGGLLDNPGWNEADFDNQNNQSLVVRVDFGEASFLFTGDMEETALATLIDFYDANQLLDVDALLVGHHGSHNATTPELLRAISPELALIAMGSPKETADKFTAFAFGHPRTVTVNMLTDAISGLRASPIDVRTADRFDSTLKHGVFSDFHVVKNIYATGWDGDITVTATKSGKFTVATHVFDTAPPPPLVAGVPRARAARARAPAAPLVALAPAAPPVAPLVAAPAAAAANAPFHWNLTVPEKNPAPGIANGKTILIDLTHGGTAGQSDWVIEGGFSDFADALAQRGYKVCEYWGVDKNHDGAFRFVDDRGTADVTQNEAEIQFDAIKDADVFVMSESNRPFRKDEQDALRRFVESGKGLFFIADHYNADRNLDAWDATEVYNGYNRATTTEFNQQNLGPQYGDLRNPQDATSGWLAQNFGVRFRFNAINCLNGASDIVAPVDAENVTQGVQPILMAAGATLAIVDASKAKGIVYLSNSDRPKSWGSAVEGANGGLYFGGRHEGPYVALSKPNRGKAAFIGDSSPIEDNTPKYPEEFNGRKKRLHNGWKDPGNAATLAVNIVDWLANSESYVGFDGTNGHTKGVLTPDPLAPQEEQDPDDGNTWRPLPAGYDPWNPATYAAGSFGAPFPAGGGGAGAGGGGTPGQPAANPVKVETALEAASGSKITVKGIVDDEFNDQFGLILVDTAGTEPSLVVQIPKDLRATFSPRLKPELIGKTIIVTGKRGLYAREPGIINVTAMSLAP